MAQVNPVIFTQALRNKICVFPTEDDCELNATEINSIIRRNPFSFNNILYKPYIKRLQGDKKYKAIKRQYVKFKKNNIIRESENPAFYIYKITDNEKRSYKGIVGQVSHRNFEDGSIRKIEKSDAVAVAEKEQFIEKTGFVAKPITLIHDKIEEINLLMDKYKSKIPLYEFTRNNGFVHEVWQVLNPDDVQMIQDAFQTAQKLYIIDDNNNFDALHNLYLDKQKDASGIYSGQEAFNFFPAFLIDKDQVKVHEYKKGIPVDFPKNANDILKILTPNFEYMETLDFELPEQGEILFYTLDKRYKLKPKSHIPADLPDQVVFEKYILSQIGKDGSLIPSDLKYCDGKRSAKCVDNQLKKGNCKFGFIIAPLSFEDIENAIQNHIRIPYKSLYLEPRPLKGLFIYEI